MEETYFTNQEPELFIIFKLAEAFSVWKLKDTKASGTVASIRGHQSWGKWGPP